mmetsp:Transcript_33347/g.51794  ORF Transcript_33347/g.51794 Transcript_33347/m.51794 type:complete len:265 (-) Transcript_33347:915-1709(-)
MSLRHDASDVRDLAYVHLKPFASPLRSHGDAVRQPSRTVVEVWPAVVVVAHASVDMNVEGPERGVVGSVRDKLLADLLLFRHRTACRVLHLSGCESLRPELDAPDVSRRRRSVLASHDHRPFLSKLEPFVGLGAACGARVSVDGERHVAVLGVNNAELVPVVRADCLRALVPGWLQLVPLIMHHDSVLALVPVIRSHDRTELFDLLEIYLGKERVLLSIYAGRLLAEQAAVLLDTVSSVGIEGAVAPRSLEARALGRRREAQPS